MRRRCLLSIVPLLGVSLLASCDDDGTGPSDPITELPRALSADERVLIDASNTFAFTMLQELVAEQPGENVFFSPLSASLALGMTMNGAAGDTWMGMRQALGFAGMDEDQINRGYADLIDLLVGLDPLVEMRIANSVWAGQGAGLLPDFVQRVQQHFDATADAVDFGAPATLARINQWVSDGTKGKITRMYDALPSGLVALLLNAVYFKGDWTEQFDPTATVSGPFQAAQGTVTAPLMRRTAELSIFGDDEATAVELEYGGGAFTFVAVLPAEDSSPDALVRTLDRDRWVRVTEGLTKQRASVVLPRFELEWEKQMNDALARLGMADAFDPSLADFSRMVQGGGVWIGEVKQKSWVSVDERGTEAAAATGVTIPTSLPAEIRLDRPFLFAIRERLSGTVLFLGVVEDPS
ncbi:MAG: serpin family protein [Gemmatimonadota bacterium]